MSPKKVFSLGLVSFLISVGAITAKQLNWPGKFESNNTAVVPFCSPLPEGFGDTIFYNELLAKYGDDLQIDMESGQLCLPSETICGELPMDIPQEFAEGVLTNNGFKVTFNGNTYCAFPADEEIKDSKIQS